MTRAATASGARATPRSSLRYLDHSGVLMPMSRFWLSVRHVPPFSATTCLRIRSQAGSESTITPSRSKITARTKHLLASPPSADRMIASHLLKHVLVPCAERPPQLPGQVVPGQSALMHAASSYSGYLGRKSCLRAVRRSLCQYATNCPELPP